MPGCPAPPRLELWCDRPQPDFPGRRIPRRKRAELVLAAAAMAAALPARDVRPRPPAQEALPGSQDPADANPGGGVETDDEPDEHPDFSEEGIRRALLARWEYRPVGIRYSRWEEMLANFASRMAARIQDEDQQPPLEPADQPIGETDGSGAPSGADPHEVVAPDLMAQEPGAQPSDGADSDREEDMTRPADLTLGRRGPGSRSDDDASYPRRKRHKQNEPEASSPQASLRNSHPLASS